MNQPMASRGPGPDDGYVYVRLSTRMANNINKLMMGGLLALVAQAGIVWLTVHDMQGAVELNTAARQDAITNTTFPLLTQNTRDRLDNLEEFEADQKDFNKGLQARLRQAETRLARLLKSDVDSRFIVPYRPPRPYWVYQPVASAGHVRRRAP